MKIYTRKGDGGETGLANGQRVSKSSCQIKELGVLDELNAALGLLVVYLRETKDITILSRAQHNCFYFGAVVAQAQKVVLAKMSGNFSEDDVTLLEKRIDELDRELPELTNFILPGGCKSAAYAHLARANCRKAERQLVASDIGVYDLNILKYLNRLSDYLFTLARYCNKLEGQNDVIWNREQYVTSIRQSNTPS